MVRIDVISMQGVEEDREARDRAAWRCPSFGRLVAVAVPIIGLVAYFAFGLHHVVTLESLHLHHEMMKSWVDGYGIGAGLAFAAIYALVVAFSVPGALVLTVMGGFLFGPYEATIYVVFGATIGATVLFLLARYALSDFLRARFGRTLSRMAEGFNQNPMCYMLILRLVPLFPFWLVNLVPALLGVGLGTYVISTFFGIIPGTLVYAMLGAGAGALLEAGEELNLNAILEFRFLAPIIGLMVLAAIPVVYKKLKGSGGTGP